MLHAGASGNMGNMRWTDVKAARFQVLRQAEAHGRLTDAERAELDGLLADLDADEADALRPVGETLEARAKVMADETAELNAKARELQRIAVEEERLLADARAYLERLRQRSDALAEEFRRVTGRAPSAAR